MDKTIRIMVIDDEKATLKGICGMLHNGGFNNLLCGASASKALELIKEGGIDLLITDWNLPGMSGLKLLQQIRSGGDKIKDMPVIIITADDAAPNIMAAKRWNVSSYMIKPLEPETLIAKIEEVCVN